MSYLEHAIMFSIGSDHWLILSFHLHMNWSDYNLFTWSRSIFIHRISHSHTFFFRSSKFVNEISFVPCHWSLRDILRDSRPFVSARDMNASHVSMVVYSPQPIQAFPPTASSVTIELTSASCAEVYHNKSAKKSTSNSPTKLYCQSYHFQRYLFNSSISVPQS